MTLYLHPTTDVADAAIHAFENGAHVASRNGRAAVVEGRNFEQYAKALKIKALRRVEAALRQ